MVARARHHRTHNPPKQLVIWIRDKIFTSMKKIHTKRTTKRDYKLAAKSFHNLFHNMSIPTELQKPCNCHGRVNWQDTLIDQQSSCIRLALDGAANEIINGVCVLLPGIVIFPAGCGKAEDIGRGKVAQNMEDQFNWNVHYRRA